MSGRILNYPMWEAVKLQQCKAIEDPAWLGMSLPSLKQIFVITLHHHYGTDTIAGLSSCHLAWLEEGKGHGSQDQKTGRPLQEACCC